MMGAKYWGEYESLCDFSEDEVGFEELDAYVDHKAVTQEMLKLYLPYDEDEFGEVVQVPEECVEMDDRVVHTVKLLQHSRTLKELLNSAYDLQSGMEQGVSEDRKHLPEPPLFPDGPKKTSKCSVSYPFRYMEKEHSEFSEGEGIPLVTLSPTVTRQVLRKVIATLIAHVGFERSSGALKIRYSLGSAGSVQRHHLDLNPGPPVSTECTTPWATMPPFKMIVIPAAVTGSVLETLCDICHEYLQKITRLMRVAANHEAMTGTSGFPDVMERVFHEMGIGSVCSLHSFYQSRVVMYHARMMHTCRLLDDEYQTLRRSLCKEEENSLRAKMDEDEDDVPEIHFPAYGEGEGDVGMLQPSLETGFQMLQSLEQESQAQLQQAAVGGGEEGGGGSDQDDDEEEVINVSDSPGHGGQESSMAAADFAQSGGQNKPRKRKRKSNNT